MGGGCCMWRKVMFVGASVCVEGMLQRGEGYCVWYGALMILGCFCVWSVWRGECRGAGYFVCRGGLLKCEGFSV